MNKKKEKKIHNCVCVRVCTWFVDLPPSKNLQIKLPFFFLKLDVNESLF